MFQPLAPKSCLFFVTVRDSNFPHRKPLRSPQAVKPMLLKAVNKSSRVSFGNKQADLIDDTSIPSPLHPISGAPSPNQSSPLRTPQT